MVLVRLRSHTLRAKLEKCTIAARQVSFLGHVVSESGIMPDPAKIEAVNNITSPRNIKDVRSFLLAITANSFQGFRLLQRHYYS